MAGLGNPTKLRDIAFISRQSWDRVVASLQQEATPATDTTAAVLRNLNPTEESRLEIFRRVCLKRLGITPDFPGGTGLPTALAVVPTGPGSAVTAPGPAITGSPTRKLKLSSVVDPTLDAEIQQMEQGELNRLYQEYSLKFGAHPAPEVDPSGDQLSALQQLIRAGALPYVAFSIWGPFGLRSLRKQVFTSYILNAATGEWSKREAPGPPNILSWEKAFRTFKCAMLLLQAAESERLDAYMDFVKDLNNQFSHECWGIIYKAEVRMRSEYMERIKRDLMAHPKHGFTEAAPWSAVFYAATRESEYWTKEVTTPSTLFLARGKSRTGGAADNSDTSEPGGSKPSGKSKGKKRKFKGDSSVFDDKDQVYAKNRKGIEICKKFNLGQCGNRCMGPHSALQCQGAKKAWSKKGKMGTGEGSQKPPEPANPPTAEQKARSANIAEGKAPAKPPPTGKPSVVKMPKRQKTWKEGRLQPSPRQPSSWLQRGMSDSLLRTENVKDGTEGIPRQTTHPGGRQDSHHPPPAAASLMVRHEYGATNIEQKKWGARPRALILFSGRSRDGDLASFLDRKGWVVVVVDLLADHPADLRNDKIYCKIIDDIRDKYYDVLGVATPCETFSPLRETPPGPRPPIGHYVTRWAFSAQSTSWRGLNSNRFNKPTLFAGGRKSPSRTRSSRVGPCGGRTQTTASRKSTCGRRSMQSRWWR